MSDKRRSKPENLKGTALRLLRMILKYKIRFFTACVCMAISSAAAVRGTYYLKPLVDDYFVPMIGKAVGDPSLSSAFTAFTSTALQGAVSLVILMVVFFLISMVTSLVESQIMASLGNQVLYDMRSDLFDSVLKQPLSSVESRTAGAQMSSFTNDMDSVGNMLRRSVPYLVNGIVTCVSIIVTMLSVHVILTLIIMAVTFLMIPVLNWLAKRSMHHTAATQACLMELNSTAKEYTQSQELVRTLGMEEKAEKQFAEKNTRLFGHCYRATTFNNSIFSVTNGINRLGYAVVLFAGAAMALSGSVEVGTVALFSQYYNSFYKPITDMTKQISNILSALAGAERIFRLMDVPPEEDDGNVTLSSEGGRGVWKIPGQADVPFRGELVMDQVAFGYIPERQILKDVSLTVEPGEKIAVLGTTGAGKTTVISLLNRLYEAWGGSILFDGIPVRQIAKKSLRKAIATVSQDSHLFTGTVAENLRLGRPDASDEELQEAARLVGSDFMISHLPDGMNTVLEKGGEMLSHGERQLLSITRAAVADAPVLILDEATSSIDTYTEKKISQALDKLMSGRTVLVIAHRLSTVQNADRIIIMDSGRIAEAGTKAELIRRKGYYYNLLHAGNQ